MRIMIYTLPKVKQGFLAEKLAYGFMAQGDSVRFYHYTPEYAAKTQFKELKDVDLAVMIGGQSFDIYGECCSRVPTLFVDKVYVGRRDYYRMVLNGHVPYYLDKLLDVPLDQQALTESKIEIHPRRIGGTTIIYAGSSQTYCKYHGLGDALEYDKTICGLLNQIVSGQKTIIYRMKASLVPRSNKKYILPYDMPPNVEYSSPETKLAELLPSCHCLVTYGSNAATEALAAGVPVVLLSPQGINPTWELAEKDINNVMHPYWPSEIDRYQLLAALATVQFSEAQITSGEAWASIKLWYKRY